MLTHSNPGWEGTGAPVIQETVARLPCLVHPPADWRLVYDGYPERVYQITAERVWTQASERALSVRAGGAPAIKRAAGGGYTATEQWVGMRPGPLCVWDR